MTYGKMTKEQLIDKLISIHHLVDEAKITNDLHERIEQALKKSEERYRLFADNITDVIWTVDESLKFTYISPSVEKQSGFTVEEALQQNFTNQLSSSSFAFATESFFNQMQESSKDSPGSPGNPLKVDLEHLLKDGSTGWAEVNMTFLYDSEGNFKGIVGVSRDISERKKAEEEINSYRNHLEELVQERTAELREANTKLRTEIEERKLAEQALCDNEMRFRALFEGSLDAIFLADPQTGKIIDANPVASELLSKPHEDLIGLHQSEIYPPHLREHSLQMFAEYIQDKKVLLPDETVIQNAEGGIKPVEVLAQIIQIDGVPVLYEIFRDISKRKEAEKILKESEARYRRMFEDSPISLWEIDLSGVTLLIKDLKDKGIKTIEKFLWKHLEVLSDWTSMVKILYINKSTLEMYEANSKEEFFAGLAQMFTEPSARMLMKGLMSIAEGKTIFETESVTKTLKDNIRHISLRWSVVPGYEKNYKRILMSVMDITFRKQVEEEIRKSQKLESLGVLAGGIAHDFNNILTAILTNISLAKMSTDDDEIYNIMSDAETASMRAQRLTLQLLTFAKGGAPIKKPAVITNLLKETTDFALSGSNVKCELSLPMDLWPVEMDEGQISQVIHNLVINADQAMPGGGTINISSENVIIDGQTALPIKKGNYLKISIADQGVGISTRHLKNIFDPFFTTKQKGSGLGLATSFSIVKNHDGYIHVDSEIEAGTTFNVYLPSSEKRLMSAQEGREEIFRGEGKILLIDDEEIVRKSTVTMINWLGYEITATHDGAAGIALYQKAMKTKQPYKVVLTDLTIPGGMGGIETAQKLLEIDSKAKVVVISGYSNNPAMSNFRDYGFCGVVTKPFTAKELSSTLNEVTKNTYAV